MGTCFGWDLGGANLKLARIEAGRPVSVLQVPCPATAAPRKFDEAVGEVATACDIADAAHAVTMTGELSDVFVSRAEGVSYLVALMARVTGGRTRFYSLAGFLEAEQAVARWPEVASANWHASAAFVASVVGDGLLIDAGTTTTDLIPLRGGNVAALGRNDGERLTEGELLYGGVVRTPVMAVVQHAPFHGRMQRVAAERFATMADVYRLTGDLPPDADPYPAADQRGKTLAESAGRLARMLGRDAEEANAIAWKALAHFIARQQIEQIEADANTLIDREELAPEAPIIGAGCGRFLAAQIAKRLARPYRDFADLVPSAAAAREAAARCAPATAVALLA